MPGLVDGARVLCAPRALTVLHGAELRHLEPAWRDTLAALVAGESVVLPAELSAELGPCLNDAAAGADETWVALVGELDQRFCAWAPGPWQADGQSWALARRLVESQRLFAWPQLSRPTLPGAMARRAAMLRVLGAAQIYVEDDPQGGALLLADAAQVTVFEPDLVRRAWLAAAAAACGRAVAIVTEPPVEADFDLALVHAGTPLETHASLARGLAAVRPGGKLAILVRPPCEWTLYDQLERAGLPVVGYARELEPWLLPVGLVADAAADLVIAERPAGATLAPLDGSAAERVRAQPYLTIDFDNLDGAKLTEQNWAAFVDLLAHQAPRPPAFVHRQTAGDRLVWCWYDEAGWGLTAELREDEDHLMVTLMPFDRELEYAVVNAAYTVFADRFTRTRPLRTRRWHEENVFG